MNYVDKHYLYNVKPVGEDGEPTGNDGLILTAYAEKIGLQVENPVFFFRKLRAVNGLPVERLPGKETPYPSRDFFLGAVFFGLVRLSGWNFSPLPLPEFNLFKLISQFWALRGKDRNHFWKNPGFEQVYRFAFSVPIHDRAFYYRSRGWKAPWIYRLIEAIDMKRSAGNNSSALIRWLKYDQWPGIFVFVEYFGYDHPITKEAVNYATERSLGR